MATRKRVLHNSEKVKKVRKDELLAKLKENRAAHEAWLKTAREEWRKDAIQMMQHNITALGDRKNTDVFKRYSHGLKYPDVPPQSSVSEVDDMIARLESSTAEFVILNKYQHTRYWSGKF